MTDSSHLQIQKIAISHDDVQRVSQAFGRPPFSIFKMKLFNGRHTWDTFSIIMPNFVHPVKITADQYNAEPTFKLLKEKHWRKWSLRSVTFSWQFTSAKVTGCSMRLWICSTEPSHGHLHSPDFAPSNYFLIRNLKYSVHGTWFIDDEFLKIAVEAWFESQQKITFSKHKQLRKKFEKCTDEGEYAEKWQYVWYNMLIFYSQVAKLFDRPSYNKK